jgi:hypothetical protein
MDLDIGRRPELNVNGVLCYERPQRSLQLFARAIAGGVFVQAERNSLGQIPDRLLRARIPSHCGNRLIKVPKRRRTSQIADE